MFDLLRLEQPAREEAADDGTDSAKRLVLVSSQNLGRRHRVGVKKKQNICTVLFSLGTHT